MGVKVKDILDSNFFKDFNVVCGFNGLDREIQAVSFFDAPDGFKWIKGKEFIVTSGYFFKDNLELFLEVINFLSDKGAAALGIKMDRYIQTVPKEAIDLCDKLNIPMIDIPYDIPWIDLINEVNSIAMTSYITRIKNDKNINEGINRSDNFNEKKKNKIVTLSNELNRPVTLIDTIENTYYTYPSKYSFQKDEYINSYGEFNFDYKKETICEEPKVFRIENLEDDNKGFIIMPIILKGREVGRVIVSESKDQLDYYDLFSVRLSYILLLEIYEQIYLVNSFERIFYDDLINSLIKGSINTKDELIKNVHSIQDFKLNIDNKFLAISIKQINNVSTFFNKREDISTMLLFNFPKDRAIFGILDNDIISIIIDISYDKFSDEKSFNLMTESLYNEVKGVFPESDIKIGIGKPVSDICNIKRSYNESIKSIDIGKYLYKEKNILRFEELGPFGLFKLENIDPQSFGDTFSELQPLFNEPNSEELLDTLEVFLESDGNYNIASQKLHIHSNTVRYRIGRIKELCSIKFEDNMEKVKLIITLKFLNGLEDENRLD